MRRTISILITLVLLWSQSAIATNSLSDLVYINSTAPNSWTSSNGTTYLYGGNIEFRFKNRSDYAPWIWGQPPKFKIGCGGMSITGGFLSLLGLNDIKEQLKNAGALFAWGVMMAINATMPMVAKVFESIRAWATKLQQLLANACKLGTAFAKSHGIGGDLLGPIDEAVGKGFEPLKKMVDSSSQFLDDVNSWADKQVKGNNKTDANSKETIKIVQSNAFGVSMASFIFGKYVSNIDLGSGQYIEEGSLRGLYNKKVGNINVPVTNEDEYKEKVLAHKIAMLFYGDIVADGKSLSEFLSKFTQDGKLNKDALVGKMMALKMGTYVIPEITLKLIGPRIDPKDAGNALIDGFSAIANDPACGSGDTCSFDDRKIVFIDLPKSKASKASNVDASNTQSSTFGQYFSGDGGKIKALVLTSDTTGAKLSLQWRGLYKETLDKIRQKTREAVGTANYTWFGSAPANTNANGFIYMTDIGKYIQTIARIEKKYKGENAYTYQLKSLLARYSAIVAAKYIANILPTVIRQAIDQNSGPGSQKAYDVLTKYLEQIEEINKHIYKAIDDMKKDSLDVYYINKLFEDIEKKIQEESLGHTGYR